MISLRFICGAALAVVGISASQTPAEEAEHFRVQQINDHVTAYVGLDPTIDLVDGNSYAIFSDDGIFVVDAHHLPVIARANIDHLRTLSNQPVEYLLITHWHGDHNTGSSAYVEAFPGVRIVAHTKTREILARRQPEWVKSFNEGEWDDYITSFDTLIAQKKSMYGDDMSPFEVSRYLRVMEMLRRYAPDSKDAMVTLPDVTFDREMTLHMGGREIRIINSGNANTPGDAWVWLPQDSILITGDVLVSPIPYCFGGFLDEWVKTLDVMLSLKPKWILPGHGEPMRDTTYLRQVRDCLADMDAQAKRGFDAGIRSADSLKMSLTLDDHRRAMCGDDPDCNYVFDYFMVEPAMKRLLKVLNKEIGDVDPGN